jgi:hypothetical protein
VKFIFLILSAIFLTVGCIKQSSIFIISGGVLYMLAQVISFIFIMRDERLSRKGELKGQKFNSGIALLNQLSILIEIIIFFLAAIVFLFSPAWLSIGCGIIVFGQIIFWFLSGFFAKSINNIPIRMGFGSWYVQREKMNRITERTRVRPLDLVL